MSSVELATGYISLVPSAKGIHGQLMAELGEPVTQAANEAGEKASEGFASSFKSKSKVVLGAAMVGVGALLTKGFADSVNFEAGNDKLAAQVGATGEQAASLGRAAAKLYTSNFGENMGQVNEAVKAVFQNIGDDVGDADNALTNVSGKVLNLANTFGQDLGGTTAAVGQLLKTGLAKNADEALDIVTRGFQSGIDKSGDFLDTLNEYGTQFRKVGIDGQTMTGLLSQGLKAGARDADLVADSIKEFSIRAVDGSKTTADGFKAIGLDAGKMAADIGKGGDTAKAALDATLDRLRAMPDPVARSQAAVQLFGTQAEDLGQALFALDPSKAVESLGQVGGAADQLGKTLSSNTANSLETVRRKFEMMTAGVGDALGPVLSVAPGFAGIVTVGSQLSGTIGGLVEGVGTFVLQTVKSIATTVAHTAATVAQEAASIAVAAAQKAWAAAQWLLNAAMEANPIGLIIAAIVLLVAGVVLAYQHSETFRNIVQGLWEGIKRAGDVIVGFAGVLKDILVGAIQWARNNWDVILTILTGPFGLAILVVRRFGDDIVGFITSIPGRITSAARGMFDGIKEAFRSAINFVIRAWNGLEFKLPEVDTHIPGVGKIGGFTLGAPNIPLLAQGGVATQSGLAIVGDAGPELAFMTRGAAIAPLAAASPGGGGGLYIGEINVQAGIGDPRAIGEEVVRAVQAYEQGAGNGWRNNPARVGG